MNYTLSINISSQDLSYILSSGQGIGITKDVANATSNSKVLWTCCNPRSMSSNVTWNNGNFYAYASNTQIASGAQICINSQSTISYAQCLSYNGITFSNASSIQLPNNTMGIQNDNMNSSYVTSGLMQEVMVNGMRNVSPINASTVPRNMVAQFVPTDNIKVFLTSSYQQSGTILSSIPSNACSLTFDSAHAQQSIVYNAAKGCFILA